MALFNPELISAYRDHLPLLRNLMVEIEADLKQRISARGIEVHSFYSRLKSEQSLRAKASRPDRTYTQLWGVTDLLGFRIVTAFEDSISEIAELLESQYSIDLGHSQNRLGFEDHEKFGYRSLHYVVRVPEAFVRQGIPSSLHFEVEVRTALQDVWAEIEHDLGYKANDLAPSRLRRRFSRVSALLEMADEELASIRSELKLYVDGRRDHSQLDLVSLKELTENPEVREIDLRLAKTLGLPLGSHPFFPDYLLKALRLSGLQTAQGVLIALKKHSDALLEFAPVYFSFAGKAWGLEKSFLKEMPLAYSLLFLAHLQIADAESLSVNRTKQFTRFYGELDYPQDLAKARQVAKTLVEAINEGGGSFVNFSI